MNKAAVIEKVIENLQQQADEIQAAIDYAYQEARSSPSATESASDGRRREQQQMAAAHEATKNKLENAPKILKGLDPAKEPSKPGIGSLIKNTSLDNQWYFIVPYGGGKKIIMGDETVITLAPDSPLGQKLLKIK